MNKIITQFKFSNGFSIVETLIVLAILGALTLIVIPSFSKVGTSEALNTTTMSVIAVLNEAKSQAVSSKDASSYGVRIFNDKLISFKGNYGTENKEITISNLMKISTSTDIGVDIIFNNVSGNTNTEGSITISALNDPTKNNIIKIYSTGLIEKN